MVSWSLWHDVAIRFTTNPSPGVKSGHFHTTIKECHFMTIILATSGWYLWPPFYDPLGRWFYLSRVDRCFVHAFYSIYTYEIIIIIKTFIKFYKTNSVKGVLSRRDAFRPCSRDSSGDKGQFCFH